MKKNNQEIRGLITKIIKYQTNLSIEKEAGLKIEKKILSEKATKAKEIIENSCFDDKESFSKLVSILLNENIEIDENQEQYMKVYQYSLIVCLKEGSDRRDAEFFRDTKFLKTFLDIDELYNEPILNKDYFDDEILWAGLSSNNVLEYCFSDQDICKNYFRFANDSEIEEFVRKIPEKIIKDCFSTIILTANFIK
ncbi:MAG: hypothetical protein PHF86_03120 [Candidatus Nanoarchaeia archaeon]|jgi:hypothetical protein|nr:hypothetical protein [Candidatus Nanoarchaeia archaeon]